MNSPIDELKKALDLLDKKMRAAEHGDGMLCRRCKAAPGDVIRLAGGYDSRLCIDCRNVWHEAIREDLTELNLEQVRMSVAVGGGDIKYAAEYADSCYAMEAALYERAKAWVNACRNFDAWGCTEDETGRAVDPNSCRVCGGAERDHGSRQGGR